MKVSSNERCTIPCEVFERCWIASRVKGTRTGLMVIDEPAPRMLCSVPDVRSGYKLFPCGHVTPTGRIRKWAAHYQKLDDFRRSFIERKIKRFFKEEREKLLCQDQK